MKALTIKPLDRARITQCFPLVHLTAPTLTAETWYDFAVHHVAPVDPRETGILVAEQHPRCILGLLTYLIDHDAIHGRTLLVKNLIAHNYFTSGRRNVELALIGAIEDLAVAEGCHAIHVNMPLGEAGMPGNGMTEELEARGHILTGVSFCKSLRDMPLARVR